MEKNEFKTPTIEVWTVEVEDVILTSGNALEPDMGDGANYQLGGEVQDA